MTIPEFMNGVLDIALERLKKQGLSVFMLILATYFFYDQRDKVEIKLTQKIEVVESALTACNTERAKLSAAVAALEARFDERFKYKSK